MVFGLKSLLQNNTVVCERGHTAEPSRGGIRNVLLQTAIDGLQQERQPDGSRGHLEVYTARTRNGFFALHKDDILAACPSCVSHHAFCGLLGGHPLQVALSGVKEREYVSVDKFLRLALFNALPFLRASFLSINGTPNGTPTVSESKKGERPGKQAKTKKTREPKKPTTTTKRASKPRERVEPTPDAPESPEKQTKETPDLKEVKPQKRRQSRKHTKEKEEDEEEKAQRSKGPTETESAVSIVPIADTQRFQKLRSSFISKGVSSPVQEIC